MLHFYFDPPWFLYKHGRLKTCDIFASVETPVDIVAPLSIVQPLSKVINIHSSAHFSTSVSRNAPARPKHFQSSTCRGILARYRVCIGIFSIFVTPSQTFRDLREAMAPAVEVSFLLLIRVNARRYGKHCKRCVAQPVSSARGTVSDFMQHLEQAAD